MPAGFPREHLLTARQFSVCVPAQSLSCVQLYVTLWTVARFPWDSPGKNTGVGCRALLQEIFLTQGSNLCLLH